MYGKSPLADENPQIGNAAWASTYSVAKHIILQTYTVVKSNKQHSIITNLT